MSALPRFNNPAGNSLPGFPGWYVVIYECDVTQWTDEILDSWNAGNPFEAFVHWVGVLVGKWTPANPDDPNKMECCTGKITRMTLAGDGDISLYIDPNDDCKDLLSAGNKNGLVCELPWSRRGRFKEILKGLEVCMKVEVCGWFVTDGGHGGQNELHPITSIDPYVPQG